MPMRWNKKAEEIVAAYDAKEGPGVLSYVMHRKNKTTATATLVITKRKGAKTTDGPRDSFFVFLTDVDKSSAQGIIANIPKIYKKSWTAKTGYRCAKQCRPRTCSRNPSVRTVLFYFTTMISNMGHGQLVRAQADSGQLARAPAPSSVQADEHGSGPLQENNHQRRRLESVFSGRCKIALCRYKRGAGSRHIQCGRNARAAAQRNVGRLRTSRCRMPPRGQDTCEAPHYLSI